MRTTVKRINALAAPLGYEIQRGRGYFYFTPLGDHDHLMDSSVYVFHLTAFSVEEWIEFLTEKMEAK